MPHTADGRRAGRHRPHRATGSAPPRRTVAPPSEETAPERSEALRAWFDQHPPAGPALIALLARVEAGHPPEAGRPRWIDGQLFLPYPAGFVPDDARTGGHGHSR
ncbi:MAG: hypothetical protein MZU95_16260 [Desulfomicrobium escambiense]|nr:hypothetical protein [Desulfomicrobium escambiense]